MSQPTRTPAPPPSYEDAVSELPARLELLSMTPAQLEHQANVEKLEHQRRLRAADVQRIALSSAMTRSAPATTGCSRFARQSHPGTRTASTRQSKNEPGISLESRLTAIAAGGFHPKPPSSISISEDAQKLTTLLRRIMLADYLTHDITQIGHSVTSHNPFSWSIRHMAAIFYSHSDPRLILPPVLARRASRVRKAAVELNIPFSTVQKLMLQHHKLVRGGKFVNIYGSLYGDKILVARKDVDELAVEMMQDAYWVIPIVARNEQETAEMLQGVVKVARMGTYIGLGHGFRRGGFVQGIEERVRWLRERVR